MKALALALALTICPVASASETLILPVQDLLREVPNFVVEHGFNVSSATNGNFVPPQNLPRGDRQTRRELERRLIDLMWEQFPEAESIRIWNGNLIVRLP